MRTGDLTLCIFMLAFALGLAIAFLVPRFRKKTGWAGSGAPLSSFSMVTIILFLLLLSLMKLEIIPSGIGVPAVIMVFVAGWISGKRDERKHAATVRVTEQPAEMNQSPAHAESSLNGSSRKRRSLFVFVTILAIVFLLLAWQKDPSFAFVPAPGKIVVLAVFAFLMASIILFSVNMLIALAKGRKAKNEEELEASVVPVMQGQDYDNVLLKKTEIARGIFMAVVLGVICAAIIHKLLEYLKG